MSFNKLLEAGGLVVGNDVEITIHVEGVARKEPKEQPAKKKK